MIKTIKIDGINAPETKEITDDLQVFYKEINCTCVDIISRKIGKKCYDIIVDDEALLKENICISGMMVDFSKGREELYGKILIVRSDDEGNLEGLSDDDVTEILKSVKNNVLLYKL